ncbi:uncharacterized protein LOC135942164 [Cloeon dipterum]|uniref:uncharacterized protein LOC135942164 n=1 Tax=Cloeon dipterum TaxID=197152 RepID=UPI0032201FC5
MSGSIRESKESIFTYGTDTPANHRVSLYVAGVCACLLILITTVLVVIPDDLYSSNPSLETDPKPPSVRSLDSLRPSIAGWPDVGGSCELESKNNSENCKVVCRDIGQSGNDEFQPGDFIQQQVAEMYINQSVSESCYLAPIWQMSIIDTYFPHNTIASNWFVTTIKTSFPGISSLEIQDCYGLNKIEDSAFANFPFGTNLTQLTLSQNMALKHYTAGIAGGLTALTAFNLRGNGVMMSVDEHILDPFKYSLQVFEIQGGINEAQLLEKMIGPSQGYLNSLVLVDLSYNSAGEGMHRLSANQLGALNMVESLTIRRSGVLTIDVDTFNTISGKLNILDLKENQLKTIQNGTFDAMKSSGRKVSLTLKEPASQRGKPLLEADMTTACPEVTTTLTPTSTTNTRPTTTAPPELAEFECKSFASQTYGLAEKKSTVERKHNYINFTIKELPDDGKGKPKVVIISNDSMEQGLTLVWHDVQDISSLNCAENFSKEYAVENLTREKTYVFCLVEGKRIETPSQCKGVTIKPAWESRAWFTNKSMPMWIGIFVVIAIACALVGAFSVILAFWRKPTLLALHSRVVKVRTSKTEAVVMPKQSKKNKTEPQADNASIHSDPSYVTVRRANRVSLVAFRFREWLRKVENGEISPKDPYTIDICNTGCNREHDNCANESGIKTESSISNL